jgi:hypothetical protein
MAVRCPLRARGPASVNPLPSRHPFASNAALTDGRSRTISVHVPSAVPSGMLRIAAKNATARQKS